ncbi:MFS transporter [Mangrovimicrobium sediminis]|uniref:MFS transporter n=1 Tax=Mangrovimicrobium sediminis TaxID=2562682 RepID=A0A4Z0LV90_9GAMM|nr:MFS transporter [Haliea sp. SAOS-164]TGD71190.1 MFS transporter [Haliea sp. SAOS-164]
MRVFPGWWQVLAAMLLQAASSASVFTAYSVIAVPLQLTFQPSQTLLMMGITVAALASGILGPPLGAAIDRFSMKLLMLAGTVLLGGGFVLLSLAGSMTQVILVYLGPLAVGCVVCGPLAGSALLARWFSRRRGLAMSLAASGGALGGLIVPPLLQYLIEAFEWRTALQIYGCGLFVLTAPLVLLLVVNQPADRGLHPDGEEPPPAPARPVTAVTGSSTLEFLRDRNFWLIALCLGLLLGGPMGLLSNLVPFVLERQLTAGQGALLLSIFSAANFAGKLTSGIVADRADHRLMLAVIMLVVGLGFFGFLQAGSFAFLALASVVLGAGQGATVPLWSMILARNYGAEKMGRSMGLMSFMIMPFTLVAPGLYGWAFDASGSYDPALMGAIALLGLALGLVFLIRPQAAASTA